MDAVDGGNREWDWTDSGMGDQTDSATGSILLLGTELGHNTGVSFAISILEHRLYKKFENSRGCHFTLVHVLRRVVTSVQQQYARVQHTQRPTGYSSPSASIISWRQRAKTRT
jgi:hypothetical protein